MKRDTLELILDLKEPILNTINNATYSDKQLIRIKEPTAEAVKATTLTALVDYIKSGLDKKSSENLIIHITSPAHVSFKSELNNDRARETYMECVALLPNNIHFGSFMGTEEFNIMLQSSFVDTEDKGSLLKVTGLIQEKLIKEVGDDGISQAATVKTGITRVDDVIVPNPVTLAPYRTFPEIEQPASRFIFRMRSGPQAALYEADGGAWRNEAMAGIKAWLEVKLYSIENIKIIS